MIKITETKHPLRLAVVIIAAVLVVGMGGATSVMGPLSYSHNVVGIDLMATQTLNQMHQYGLLKNASQVSLEDLLEAQNRTQKPLATFLRDPKWAKKLGIYSTRFKATWYAANPYDMLPAELRAAIRKYDKPFRNRNDIRVFLKTTKAPQTWIRSLDLALIETTPSNLWRASRGLQSYTRNGQFLKPLVIEKEKGQYVVKDGHIAVDPSIIPLNSEVLLVLKVDGKDRLIKVKAADTGGAIRGRHVDLPIYMKPSKTNTFPNLRFPREYISNPTVEIIIPGKKVSPDQKV